MVNRNQKFAAGICLFVAAVYPLAAQSNTADVFGGYSYTKANPLVQLPKENMNGWIVSASGFANSWFGAGLEISGSFGHITTPSGIGAPNPAFKEYSYLVGPQFRFLNMAKVRSSFKLLLGGAFGQVNLDSATTPAQTQALGAAGISGFNQTKFAALFAVPVDVTVTKLVGIRVEPGLYLTDFSKTKQSNFRFSVGPVFRFGGR
jgi:hypothetical protein